MTEFLVLSFLLFIWRGRMGDGRLFALWARLLGHVWFGHGKRCRGGRRGKPYRNIYSDSGTFGTTIDKCVKEDEDEGVGECQPRR